MQMKKHIGLSLIASCLAGCALLPRAELPVNSKKGILPIERPSGSDVVGSTDDLTIDISGISDKDMFVSLPLQSGDPIPDITVEPFSISNATVYNFMRAILDDNPKISFSIDSEHPGANVARRFVTATNVSGKLKSVLDTFSNSVGFDYYYAEGVLHLTQDRQYIAKIPPVNDLFDSLPPMLKTLGATDVFVDKTSRTVTYRASKPIQSKTSAYLKWVRDNKKLIIYETYIAEVILDDASTTGIQWNNLSWTGTAGKTPVTIAATSTAGAVAGAGSVGVGAMFTGAHFSMNVLANFLKTQGTVNQLSKIPMMLIAGGETTFHNGGTNYYVSSIGAPTITASGQTIQGQSQLSPLITGIDLKLSGDIFDGTVFTNVVMAMNALTGYASFPAGSGQTMQAPITTDRKVTTAVRVRPGDTIMIAGINYESTHSTTGGVPGIAGTVALPSNISRAAQRSELVVVMRPKVIAFADNREVAQNEGEKQ
jgi:hypothetical protein